MKFPARRRSTTAMTLPEVLVALLLLGLFLPSVFAVNGVCLRLINATKESTAALQSLHDRGETLRNLAFTDRTTCVIFGDGAGAVLLEPAAGDEGILDFEHDIDGSGGQFLFMPGGGSLNPPTHETVEKKMHYVHQEGSQVFKYAVRRMSELAANVVERNGLTGKDIALVVPHQANLRIIRAMQERLGLPDDKVMVNIDRYGNTTAGTIPLGLRDAVEQGKLKKGDLVLLMAVGAGYTTGSVLLRWAY